MEQFIGCDAHKKYSVFVAVNERGEPSPEVRVGHDREQYRRYLERLPTGSQNCRGSQRPLLLDGG